MVNRDLQVASVALLVSVLLAVPAGAQGTGAAAPAPFTREQIEQMVAPIALYPDPVVAQILMASTYPLQIVEAARWVGKNPGLEDEALTKAVEPEDWDPSVKSLIYYPDVLQRMSDDLDWTQDLGDAVLAQQEEVMDAVQRMRGYAMEAGNLESNEQQTVVVEEKIIKVEPAAQTVYVPAYNPTVVYGTYWGPPVYYYPVYSYPPSYWYPPGYVAATSVISFGVGVAVGAAVWGGCDWGGHGFYHRHGDVDIDIDRNIDIGDINIDKSKNFQKWEHNPVNRKSVRYRDSSTRQKFDNRRIEGNRQARIDRDTARGYDPGESRDLQRPSTRDVQRPANRDVQRPATRPATRDVRTTPTRSTGGSSAFKPGNSSFDRSAVKRGASSRGRSVSSHRGGGGHRGGRGGGGRRGR
jgi:hypothetical protein